MEGQHAEEVEPAAEIVRAQRTGIVIQPDPKRVLFRPFFPGNGERAVKVIARVMALSEEQCHADLLQVLRDFEGRHMRLVHYFQHRFEENKTHLATGLPISREIVERHGGTLTVRDEPGLGSCFRVTLPLAASERAAWEPPATAGADVRIV